MYTKMQIMPRTIGGMIEDMFQNGFNRVWADDAAESSDNAPVNIHETDDIYELQLMAPGLKKEDIKVGMDRNVLTISYEQKDEHKAADKAKKWLRTEYRMKSFKRSFTLNEKIDGSNISARYTDGILYVELPKKSLTETKAQEINVG